MTGQYEIADLKIRIDSLYDEVHNLCRDYQTGGDEIDFAVKTIQSDIDFERVKSDRRDELEGDPAPLFRDGYLETLAVYRQIAEKAPFFDRILFHGSAVAVDGEAYLFTAKSGTGKSTHTRFWRELFGERAVMVNDDKPLIRAGEQGCVISGTPWDGKHRLSSRITVPLKAVCILERAEKNRIRPVTAGEAYPMLLQQVYRPLDGNAMRRTLELIDRLVSSVSLWRLGCNMSIEAAQTAFDAMKGKKS